MVFNIDSIGSRGGLSLAWRGDVDIMLQSFSNHHIDVIIEDLGDRKKWRFTGSYGSPYTHDRDESWNPLQRLHNDGGYPWLVYLRKFYKRSFKQAGKSEERFRELGKIDSTEKKIKIEVLTLKLATLLESDRSDENLAELIDTKIHLNFEIEKNECYWEQRARLNWLKLGDKNTAFFHKQVT
ncbi:hypothetical protein PVK06_030696 [Gossypium arboreum]|uniref:Reverse transcriptase n=1 Tax=Gossypium arboreum TaxID=29729 RepID=A0ABR0NP11_GOSAR|nr:hypothetical protein PVK06_030696 [Gossypium arboreum]